MKINEIMVASDLSASAGRVQDPAIYRDDQRYVPLDVCSKSPCPPLKKGERFSPADAFPQANIVSQKYVLIKLGLFCDVYIHKKSDIRSSGGVYPRQKH